jgi:hypothetical protein
MRYTLLLYYPDMMSNGELGDEAMQEGRNAFDEFARELDAAGVLVSGEMMNNTPASKTVRKSDDEAVVEDGPPVQLVEPVGGAFIIDVPDEAAAIDWAMKVPSLDWGPVEVRSTMARYVDGKWTTTAD